ncbi:MULTISPECIES: ribosome recycling factor [unclassified Siphonobacter]|uniref:ribosome recycling factor n=1 Tax=unclassified Siphonobacter TaxID=2635712 RepID=UPI000CC5DB32|nr:MULTISPECIES: ribosome recycling factor [unclassified Siphonobacter]MDQ1089408.1 ribosome recycling factor [Siphonobacter sp. SORGH_AS_1065]MDR6195583.1 ribosome recycling factor [Siphonobacter sp. SORGH_AS_0500]PKK35314.1 ribosome recycling factor [Siphonobacter sp. SORGH_AS_0500]
MDEIEFYLEAATETMEGAMKHLNIELSKIRAGKASPAMLEGVMVEYYGVPSPLQNVASITTPDARTITVKPFEKKMVNDIDRAIRNSNLGFSPANDGEVLRISIPPVTEERRRDLVKRVKAEIETAKVNIRNARQDANNSIKKLTKDGVAEDAVKEGEDRVQKLTDKYVAKIDQVFLAKEVDIMSV